MLKQKEWINVIVEKSGCSKKDAKAVFDLVFDSMRDAVAAGEKVKIAEVGVFKLKITKAKEQINITTGQLEVVPEHKAVAFKPYVEIDPKPEAIEVEIEDDEAPVVEDTPVEEEVVEEVVEETAAPEVVEETPVEEEVVEEVTEEVVEDDGFTWLVGGNEVKTADLVATLVAKSELSEKDVKAALNSVIENSKKVGKTSAEVQEDDSSFSFIISK